MVCIIRVGEGICKLMNIYACINGSRTHISLEVTEQLHMQQLILSCHLYTNNWNVLASIVW